MKTRQEFQARHGDVFLRRVKAIPEGAARQERQGDVALAAGEVTGHAHRIATPGVSLWHAGTQRYIQVEEPADLTHEEHGTITLPPGVYEVIRQREWSLENEARTVTD